MGAKLFSFPDYETDTGHLILGHLKRYWDAQPSPDYRAKVGDVALLNAKVFQALQLTNRMEHAMEIQRLMDIGTHVVADRYWPSGWVYGQADGLDPEWLTRIQAHLPQPDLYILLNVPAEQSVIRRPERRDRYEEQEGLMEQAAVLYRQLWADQAKRHGKRSWVVIDGSQGIADVHAEIMQAVEVLG